MQFAWYLKFGFCYSVDLGLCLFGVNLKLLWCEFSAALVLPSGCFRIY